MKKVLALLVLAAVLVLSSAWALAAGDTLIVGNPTDAVSLDPHRTNDAASALPMFQIYDTLVKLSPEMTIEPSLAESWTQIDENTLHIVFDEPQRAISYGQAVVLYDGDYVVGGGTICRAPEK